MNISTFIRNDDVRGELDETLIYLTERFLDIGVLLIHAVEPKNVSLEVIKWLITLKESHFERVSIIQHGLDHSIKTTPPIRGEFGGGRPFDQQRAEIQQGKLLMDKHFGDLWDPVFSFPYGSYDKFTLHALVVEGYQSISTGVRFTFKRRVFNAIGRFLRVKHLAARNIIYFNEQVPGYKLMEYPVVLNNTKKQTAPDSGIQKNASELMQEWNLLPSFIQCVGILTHHRFNKPGDINELSKFLINLQSRNVKFPTLRELFRG